MDEAWTVFVVDDDASITTALARLLGAYGYKLRTFLSAEEYLASDGQQAPGCLLLDVSMPGLTGLELQERLIASGATRPIIFLTGRGDIPSAVRAMKGAAVDFLTKPVDQTKLLAALALAADLDRNRRQAGLALDERQRRLGTLTAREREVFDLVAQGRLNKQIAGEIGAAEKTVKVHRGRMMRKLGVRTVADVVRIADSVRKPGSPGTA
jgi:FixJ family two-component response regulator